MYSFKDGTYGGIQVSAQAMGGAASTQNVGVGTTSYGAARSGSKYLWWNPTVSSRRRATPVSSLFYVGRGER